MGRIAIFCGASAGNDPRYMQMAIDVGRTIANRGNGIVYGGGHVGLMGLVADAAMKAGGEVIGVIPRFMEKAELAHQGVTQLILVDTMHERKQRMHELSSAVIALPGGFGTMDELFELLTWRQIGLHEQPIGLLNAFGFYDALLQQVEHMRKEGFLHGDTRLVVETEIERLLDRLA
ncbi:MAG: TIGR00730 family Rossman fold protein [Flavobacteriales bacterium]|nr:TIGR00730 family Rossman fold protein [Flavobacteriales bacterium]MBL0046145.1 TIGR00730 family Rossman fold protein [Flavobacteriales bacterium]